MLTLLAIDTDIETHMKEAAAWVNLGVKNIRVDSMQAAIENLTFSDYMFIAINGDNINYLPQLRILSDMTMAPIGIMTHHFTTKDEVAALRNGADSFVAWRDSPDENRESALALIQRLSEIKKKKAIKLLSRGNMLLSISHHKAFINDIELSLSRTEFHILVCLMNNRGRILSYKQIYRCIWHGEYDEVSADSLFSTIKRLRKKIRDISPEDDCIENIPSVGYRISTELDQKG